MLKKVITLFHLVIMLIVSTAHAELRKTKSADAICNDGQQAAFTYFSAPSRKWFIMVEGGGLAYNVQSYRNRPQHLKSPISDKNYGKWSPIAKDFDEKGYNILVIPHCSSDMHQGFQTHQIDGTDVPFHGRKIWEDIFAQFDAQLTEAEQIVIVGWSAGGVGISFNIDLLAKYENLYVVIDSSWADKESQRVQYGWAGFNYQAERKFSFANIPAHCKQGWDRCFPSRALFDLHGVKHVFPIWNKGDRHAEYGSNPKMRKYTHEDIDYYGAGFSVDAKKRQLKGFEENNWGHVMTVNDLYHRKVEGLSVAQLIGNWVEGRAPSKLVLD